MWKKCGFGISNCIYTRTKWRRTWLHQGLPVAPDAKAPVLGTNRFAIVAKARVKFKSATENQSDMICCSKLLNVRTGAVIICCRVSAEKSKFFPGVESEAHLIEAGLKALCAQLMPAAAQTALEQRGNRFDAVLCASLLVNAQAYFRRRRCDDQLAGPATRDFVRGAKFLR